jgi:WhiB family transcriptional regulator, redox-sensing transcriptional regulator
MHVRPSRGRPWCLVTAPAVAVRVPVMPRVAARAVGLDWMSRGACRREDPGLFFPAETDPVPLERISAAKAVCGRCPVRRSCLSHAIMTRQDGIWGGTTEAERRAIRRSRRGATAGAA